jgi:hypothetical protein
VKIIRDKNKKRPPHFKGGRLSVRSPDKKQRLARHVLSFGGDLASSIPIKNIGISDEIILLFGQQHSLY